MESEELERVAGYVAARGAGARPLREAVLALAESPHTLEALVAATTLPRRDVEGLLETLGDDLERSPDGARIRPGAADAYRHRFSRSGGQRLPEPLAQRLERSPDVLARVEELVRATPAPLPALDHVAATPETAARRAMYLDATYDLDALHLLCLGDHDLTSLATCATNPLATVTVVDVDERLLAYIDEEAHRRGWAVRCLYADLRHHLPVPARERADLVFTDPPYTAGGLSLFAARGLEGLRDRQHGRLLLAYGFAESHPGLGLKGQRALQQAGLVFEAVLPGFNRYRGAQAIGGASDLYVCRPTARSRRKLARGRAAHASSPAAGPAGDNLYTHGPWAQESVPDSLDPPLAEALSRIAAGDAGARLVLVGPGWGQPAQEPGRPESRRLGLAALIEGGGPARVERAQPLAIAANLRGDPGAWLPRVLLAAGAGRVAALVADDHPEVASAGARRALSAMLGSKYALRFLRGTPAAGHAVVEAVRVDAGALDDAAWLTRRLLDRAHGTIGSVWREGLIRLSRRGSADDGPAGARVPLSRNAARALIRQTLRRPDLLGLRLIDLPRHQIPALLEDVAATSSRLAASDVPPGPPRVNPDDVSRAPEGE